MASHDLRDVLNLPADGSTPRPSKKQKTTAARPNLKGLAREVQNLGGDNPIAIVPDVSVFKKKRFASRKPAEKWDLRAFQNTARSGDNLILRHWRRKTEVGSSPGSPGAQPVANGDGEGANGSDKGGKVEDSAFAKYNVHPDVPQYSDDQYNANLQDADWTKDETDYLLELVRDFDLRWPLIWDRYDYRPKVLNGDAAINGDSAVIPAPKQRTMEDLKARYYKVAAAMMAVQKPVQYMTGPEFSLHETMTKFRPEVEKQRKEFVANGLTRSSAEAKEEESLLIEIRRILARAEKFNEDRRELYSRLDFPPTDQDISVFKSSQGLQNLLQNLMNVDKSKKRKSLMGADGGASPSSGGPQPGSAVQDSASRRDSVATPATAEPMSSKRESLNGPPTGGGGAGGSKKAAQAQAERRKLSERERQVYGVSQHERLTSGATFRYERVNKLYAHKSHQQQTRITTVLNELGVPARLTMPTAAVTAQFEVLLQSVLNLVELRKVTDKVDNDVKVELARKAERDKARAPPAVVGVDGAGDEKPTKGAATNGEGGEATKAGKRDEDGPAKGEDTSAAPEVNGDGGGDADADAPKVSPAAENAAETNGDVTVETSTVKTKQDDGDKEKGARPGSSGAQKRSASVLSAASDKSAKRLKK